MSSDESYVEQAGDVGTTEAARRVFVAPLLATASGLAGLVAVAFEQVGGIFKIFGDAREFLGTLITEPGKVIVAGAEATGASLSEFGVAALIVAVLVVVAAFRIYEASGTGIPVADTLLPWR